jgi:nickel-dependent lactate racemase
LVKTLHAIDTIANRISAADVQRVPLVREAGTDESYSAPSVDDPAAATVQALAEPLEFPPLSSATVPGDRVAIAVDHDVPHAAAIVRGVIEVLHRAGIDDDGIAIVTTDGEIGRRCREELDGGTASAIQSVTHDPDDENNLCLVAVRKRREPLRVNRTIYDADVVLPIGCTQLDGRGPFDGLFPWFAGAETVDRYRTPSGHESQAAHEDMLRETNEAGWLIGAPLVMTIVPGADESVAHVLAGDPQAVARQAAELCRQQWAYRSPQRASLVIANISGGAGAQTWANVGRALAAAERLVEQDGAVAICTNLDRPPGESLGHLIDCADLSAAQRKIAHEHAEDSWPAWQLARALERGPVYFLSQLDADTVEEMGMAPVADVDELVRLAGRHESVIMLEDAQHAIATVDGEDDET